MKNNAYSYPVFVATGGLATSGHVTDLAPGQLGVFYREPSQNVATSPKERDEIFLAIGSVRKYDKLGQIAGYKQPSESSYFRVKDIESFEIANPSKELKSNIISVGFSGGSCSEGIKFQCDTNYVFTITITGSPVLREFGKPLIKTLSYNTGCCPGTGCDTCQDTLLDCETHTKNIVELINKEVELTQAGLKSRYVSNTYVAPVANKTKYSLTVCDDGDQNALNAVQAKVGKLGLIYRKARKDCKSEYEYCGDAQAPNFIPTQSVAFATCGVCELGYTLVPASQVVIVKQPVQSTTDTSTDAAKLALATTIATSYTGTSPIFQTTDGATVTVSFEVPVGTVLTPLLSDVITLGIIKAESCVPTAAATPIAWVVSGTAYKVKRKLKVTLQRVECSGADRLAELTAHYANHPEVVAGSIVKLPGSTGCEDCYEIEQWSKGCMSDECLATDSANFNEFGSFIGQLWEVVPTVPVVDLTRKCGFTLQAHIDEQTLSNCSFSKDDFYETEPIHLEFSWEVNYPDVCSTDLLPKIKNKGGEKYLRQSGEAIVRMLIDSSAYDWACGYSDDPLMRERLGQELLNQVDRKAFYKIYYLKFVEARAGVNTFAEQPRRFEPMIIVKDTDPISGQIETSFGKLSAVAGVSLTNREDTKW
jgi:hypothetical protein